MSKCYVFLSDPPATGMLNKREAWFPRTGDGYFDPSAKRWFETKQKKRAWLAAHGMREAGELVNPNKYIAGREKSRPDPRRAQIDAYLRAQGGTAGLLERIKREPQRYV